ncbi:MAG: hypothetical protein ABIQ41_01845 [Gemmatimonadales bacterium]
MTLVATQAQPEGHARESVVAVCLMVIVNCVRRLCALPAVQAMVAIGNSSYEAKGDALPHLILRKVPK